MYRTSHAKNNHVGQCSPVLSAWNPFLAVALRWNAQAHDGLSTVASEWQDFVRRRLDEDFALMQRVARSGTPDQIWSAYADFWQKAADDYGKELTTMTKLMAGTTGKMVASAQPATDDASMSDLPTLKAA